MATLLHRVRVPTTVPLAEGTRDARAQLNRRPSRVTRSYCWPPLTVTTTAPFTVTT
jgi:hypothetical protein